MDQVVTLVIHGTYAAQETWWRLGDGRQTFADGLEEALKARGQPGTVWRPVLDAGFDYEDFGWSGENLHGERVDAGTDLARRLGDLADRLGATRAAPLRINLVAHSHGGNVVLDALRSLGGAVRTGKIVLLGTPLICFKPRFRPIRVLSLYATLTIILFFIPAMILGTLAGLFQSGEFDWSAVARVGHLVWLIPLFLLFLGMLSLMAAWLLDAVWWVIGRLGMMAVGRRGGHAYGPVPASVEATLLTSRLDEADLLLQLGAAPQTLYKEWAAKRSRWVRVLLRYLLRPALFGLVLSIVELTLERLVLGFSWRRALFFDHEMAKLKEGRHYASVRRVDVTDDLLPTLLTGRTRFLESTLSPTPEQAEQEAGERGAATLRQALEEVGEDLIAQIRLRHSTYYENQVLIDHVADILCGLDTQASS